MCCVQQTAQQDIEVERETYQQSRQSLDAMYQDVRKKLQDETQMRLVCNTNDNYLLVIFTLIS